MNTTAPSPPPRFTTITARRDRHATQRQIVRLRDGDARRIPAHARMIRVISGCAWLTANGEDIVLSGGEWAVIPSGPHPAVIAPSGGGALVYEIR